MVSLQVIKCKYYIKENKEYSRCVMDSSVGYCIRESGMSCQLYDREVDGDGTNNKWD